MRRSQRGPFSCIVTALIAFGGAALAGQQDQGDSVIITQRLNGVEVDMWQARGGGFVQMRSPQVPNLDGSDPMMGPIVRNAPYSGDGITTVVQTLGDGTRIEQEARARFYRDSSGRIRREQTIIGLAPLNPAANSQVVVTIVPNPDDGWAYQLDAEAHTARRVMRGAVGYAPIFTVTMSAAGIGRGAAPSRVPGTAPVAGGRRGGPAPQNRSGAEQLGSRLFEGVRATGTKTTTTIPTGEIGNDRPIKITDERWESPDLKVFVYSRHSDPRTGVVEYRLTGVNRAEPAQGLFQIPPDYEVLSPGGGARTGGPGPTGAGARGDPATIPVPPGTRGGRH